MNKVKTATLLVIGGLILTGYQNCGKFFSKKNATEQTLAERVMNESPGVVVVASTPKVSNAGVQRNKDDGRAQFTQAEIDRANEAWLSRFAEFLTGPNSGQFQSDGFQRPSQCALISPSANIVDRGTSLSNCIKALANLPDDKLGKAYENYRSSQLSSQIQGYRQSNCETAAYSTWTPQMLPPGVNPNAAQNANLGLNALSTTCTQTAYGLTFRGNPVTFEGCMAGTIAAARSSSDPIYANECRSAMVIASQAANCAGQAGANVTVTVQGQSFPTGSSSYTAAAVACERKVLGIVTQAQGVPIKNEDYQAAAHLNNPETYNENGTLTPCGANPSACVNTNGSANGTANGGAPAPVVVKKCDLGWTPHSSTTINNGGEMEIWTTEGC